MKIIGAGLAGLLCGALNPGSTILERGPERESEHKALFRCRTGEIGRLLGIPFKEVYVPKGIWLNGHEKITPRIAHMYSRKVSGSISSRSILNIENEKRFIPPDNFIDLLKEKCNIEYNMEWEYDHDIRESEPVISTIPMDKIIKGISFKKTPIFVTRFVVKNCNSFCTVYYPNPEYGLYRASINGDVLISESISPSRTIEEQDDIFDSFGLFKEDIIDVEVIAHRQEYGKILPINEMDRTNIITDLTLRQNIYSLGRFATWRPKLMLDDVLEDIFVIRRLINQGNYGSLKHKQGEKS